MQQYCRLACYRPFLAVFPSVKLSLTHTIECEPSKFIAAVSVAWPMVLSNLKSLLETASIALQKPYPVVTNS
jgi:hypothetical protein